VIPAAADPARAGNFGKNTHYAEGPAMEWADHRRPAGFPYLNYPMFV
jgi:hypothetical protein